jgi:hypothetical protein
MKRKGLDRMRGNRRTGVVGILVWAAAATLVVAACGSTTPATSAVPPTAAPPASALTTTGTPSTAPSVLPDTAPPSGGLDSCSVVSQAEAASALGHAVKPPVRGKATVEGGVACVFYGPSAPAGANPDIPVIDSVRVVLVIGPDAQKFFDDFRSKVPAQAIPGFGDQAYYDGSASLSVLKGDEYLRVAVIGVADVLVAEKGLAQTVLPKM